MYTATDATLPVFASWCEEYAIEPIPDGGRLKWTLAVTPRYVGWMPSRWLVPVLSPLLKFGVEGLRRELSSRDEFAR
ncbi:MAG: hypothetical protein ACRD0U_04410 [Acidimicrobiales bacterium]